MRLKFKHQAYQAASVQAVVDCFKGQLPNDAATRYRIDPGNVKDTQALLDEGFKNADIQVSDLQLLENIQQIQRKQNLPQSSSLASNKVCKLNLDIEMETGTGKTYCYIKSIFELNRQYGWNKFIIVVPSIAIREGVYKSLEITREHFLEEYHKQARFFIYNSKSLHELEGFSSDAGINIMVINVQAFNARGKDARRIYEELDDFQSRRPIDVIKANRPIMILDEPQKMEGKKTLESFTEFNPLFMLRYSATHATEHNKIYRLDALDAYNQKLVKKIGVRGITAKGLAGTNAYLFLEGIDISTNKPPVARLELEVQRKNGDIVQDLRKVTKGTNLFDLSEGLNQYQGFVVSDINANTDVITFTNGVELSVGEASGDINESIIRRIQIREAIKAHFEKEQKLFDQGIKVLTLFFIDAVAKYRDYSVEDEKGEYAHIFEEEYKHILNEVSSLEDTPYQRYLKSIHFDKTHNGYFSIDKKTKQLVDPKLGKKTTEADDVDAYDLILKDKERLLSFSEPTRFIFSHSALREGWDNPNVFVICALKHSDNTVSRRQEVGRGLRLAVNQYGERIDHPSVVHDVNRLTVVASEGYKDFVSALQKDIASTLSARPRVADESYFTGKLLVTNDGNVEVTPQMAKLIYRYLAKHEYTDLDDHISEEYHQAKREGSLATLPEPLSNYAEQVFQLIDSVYSDAALPSMEDERKTKTNHRNNNFHKKEFQELWNHINRKAVYTVQFNSDELVEKSTKYLDEKLRVRKLEFTVERGEQIDNASMKQVASGNSFKVSEKETADYKQSIHSAVKYDLLGKIAEGTKLKRSTVASILKQLNNAVFAQFQYNPEDFISLAIKLINEQKATVIIEHLAYDTVADKFDDAEIFTENQAITDFSRARPSPNRHVYNYVITDSGIEDKFVDELEVNKDVVVYAKLPRGFFIPTPVGDYNPDWAIAFEEDMVKHVFFVAETKGSMSSLDLKGVENAKIDCAKRFFEKLNTELGGKPVKYDVVKDFESLKTLVM
ncbi:type III restriction enzyme res subunit [Oleiphilus messinensis]|uniref:Type III restriction enzyme res subunit n=1 Tax=Oleiphilus messinensis TaxID=141451 RepID=A0A1Y0ICF1_9GAMM|nr:DEAD/DEAH box helicase family protein [Oleiphilus messinensis]ARU58208.1 type III restriction enzyme res subunit [Oleiphilus messinensis]